MPCDIGRLSKTAAENPIAAKAIRQVLEAGAQWLNGTSGEILYQEALSNSEAFRLENLAGFLAMKPLLCVGGTLDMDTPPAQHFDPFMKSVWAAGGTMLHSINFPSDHFFSNYRETVIRTVEEFLLELPSVPKR